jgi:hypothetical protein
VITAGRSLAWTLKRILTHPNLCGTRCDLVRPVAETFREGQGPFGSSCTVKDCIPLPAQRSPPPTESDKLSVLA